MRSQRRNLFIKLLMVTLLSSSLLQRLLRSLKTTPSSLKLRHARRRLQGSLWTWLCQIILVASPHVKVSHKNFPNLTRIKPWLRPCPASLSCRTTSCLPRSPTFKTWLIPLLPPLPKPLYRTPPQWKTNSSVHASTWNAHKIWQITCWHGSERRNR
jgi:hypothetical protein